MRASRLPACSLLWLTLGLWLVAARAQAQGAPAVSPEFEVPGARVRLEEGSRRLAVAFDGKNFLLVWADSGGNDLDLYGVRVSPTGQVLEPGVFPITTAPDEQSYPDVAFNGTHFLVTWNDHRTGDAWNLHAARVSPAGQVLDPNSLVLSSGPAQTEKFVPAVDCLGAQCLVIWSERRAGSSWDILGRVVNANGTVTSEADLPISVEDRGQFTPAVVRRGNEYFAAWSDQREFSAFGIYSTAVSAAGQPDAPVGGALGPLTSDTYERPALAWDGTNIWVAWTTNLPDPASPALFLRNTHTPGGRVTSGGTPRHPSLLHDGTWLWLVYEHAESPDSGHTVQALRFARDGQAVDTAPHALSGTNPGAGSPVLAHDGQGHILVAYASHEPNGTSTTPDRVFYRVVTSLPAGASCGADAECANGSCANGRCCDRPCDGACETCLRAEGATADGVCGPASPRVCRAATSTCDAEERCDGQSPTCPADALVPDETVCAAEAVCRAGSCQPLPPRFTASELRARATCGQAAQYEPDAAPTVAGAGPFAFSLESGPDGLTVEPTSGALQWVPGRSLAGNHQARLRVTGPGGSAVSPLSIEVECPGPSDLRVACGCSGGGEGVLLLALPGLLAWTRRRRIRA